MGGLFGCISKEDCVNDLFYGTDYHSHLGTKRGGLAVKNAREIKRSIHNIERDYFRSKFESDLPKLHGNMGIGIISDHDDQPLIISSHLGTFAIVTVCKINNIAELTAILRVLEIVDDPQQPIVIHTDSEYSIGVLVRNWKAKANRELIGRIKGALARFQKVEFVKVRGHAGVYENELVDDLARISSQTQRELEEV